MWLPRLSAHLFLWRLRKLSQLPSSDGSFSLRSCRLACPPFPLVLFPEFLRGQCSCCGCLQKQGPPHLPGLTLFSVIHSVAVSQPDYSFTLLFCQILSCSAYFLSKINFLLEEVVLSQGLLSSSGCCSTHYVDQAGPLLGLKE